MPGIASALIVLIDMYSLLLTSVINKPGEKVTAVLQNDDIMVYLVTTVIAVICTTFTVTVCYQINSFNKATRDILRRFQESYLPGALPQPAM